MTSQKNPSRYSAFFSNDVDRMIDSSTRAVEWAIFKVGRFVLLLQLLVGSFQLFVLLPGGPACNSSSTCFMWYDLVECRMMRQFDLHTLECWMRHCSWKISLQWSSSELLSYCVIYEKYTNRIVSEAIINRTTRASEIFAIE